MILNVGLQPYLVRGLQCFYFHCTRHLMISFWIKKDVSYHVYWNRYHFLKSFTKTFLPNGDWLWAYKKNNWYPFEVTKTFMTPVESILIAQKVLQHIFRKFQNCTSFEEGFMKQSLIFFEYWTTKFFKNLRYQRKSNWHSFLFLFFLPHHKQK